MKTYCRLLMLSALVLFSTRTLALPPEYGAREKIAPSYMDLRNQAQVRGAVRVIATYEGGDRNPYSSERRQALSRVQALTARLNVTTIKSLQRHPVQVYALNARQLDAMLDSGLFTRLEEDRLNPPQLLESLALIGGVSAHSFGLTGNSVQLAILDTGVDASHPVFGGRVVEEACFSTTYSRYSSTSLCPNGQGSQTGTGAAAPCASLCSHGTHVASIAAGQEAGRPGVAPDAGIIAIQVFSYFDRASECGAGQAPCVLAYDSDIVQGLAYVESLTASYSIASVNLSLGGGKFVAPCDSSSYKPFFDDLAAAGVLSVVSSGNSGYTDGLASPACVSTAFSVGSVDDISDGVNSWSNSASFLDILAPGRYIRAAVPGGGYATMQGTSMAAPHVTGAAALIRARSPSLGVAGLKSLLTTEAATVLDARNGLSFPRLDLGRVATALAGPAEQPTVSITYPANNAVIAVDEGPITLVATATDAQDGDLSGAITWTSNLDGVLSSPAQLSVDRHQVQASISDSDSFTATDSIVIDIVNKPSLQIISPTNNAEQLEGQSIQLHGTATDVEDGDLSPTLIWHSSLDGALAVGATATVFLTNVGVHTISASVSDGDGHAPTVARQVLVTLVADSDKDGVPDSSDNCPNIANPDQSDINGNGLGDSCDPGYGC